MCTWNLFFPLFPSFCEHPQRGSRRWQNSFFATKGHHVDSTQKKLSFPFPLSLYFAGLKKRRENINIAVFCDVSGSFALVYAILTKIKFAFSTPQLTKPFFWLLKSIFFFVFWNSAVSCYFIDFLIANLLITIHSFIQPINQLFIYLFIHPSNPSFTPSISIIIHSSIHPINQ